MLLVLADKTPDLLYISSVFFNSSCCVFPTRFMLWIVFPIEIGQKCDYPGWIHIIYMILRNFSERHLLQWIIDVLPLFIGLFDWMVDCLIDWLFDWLIDWLIYWLRGQLLDQYTDWSINRSINWVIYCSIDWLIDLSIVRLIDRLIDRFF